MRRFESPAANFFRIVVNDAHNAVVGIRILGAVVGLCIRRDPVFRRRIRLREELLVGTPQAVV